MTRNVGDSLAPPGRLKEPYQAIANERSLINGARFRSLGLKRTKSDLGAFLRRMADNPKAIKKGIYSTADLPIVCLIDHIRLYNQNRKPYAAVFHPYTRLTTLHLDALIRWAHDAGLEVCVDADSEYYPGVTLRIVVHRRCVEPPTANLV